MPEYSFHIARRMNCPFAFEAFEFEFCYSNKGQAVNVLDSGNDPIV